MKYLYACAPRALSVVLLLTSAGAAFAQAPVITSVVPMANARAVAPTSPLTVSFSQPLPAASAGALKVFSSQRGGLRARGATPAVVSGNALSFAPTAYPYRPGETVSYTVVPTTAPGGGTPGRVGQFTAAVGGTGRGNFQPGSDPAVNTSPYCVAMADVDNDGDLDLLAGTGNMGGPGAVSLRLNDGSGQFGGGVDIPVGMQPSCMVLGDVDGDGDLDLLTGNRSNLVSLCFNNGVGQFSTSLSLAYTAQSIGLADVDGDGDLDLLTGNYFDGFLSINVNNGAGQFNRQLGGAGVIGALSSFAMGDIDGDGDLDMLLADVGTYSYTSATVKVARNNGNALFSTTQNVAVGSMPFCIGLGDIDGDGDLDLLVSILSTDAVSVRLNNGTGTFSGSQSVAVGGIPYGLTVGDVDGDGDLDFLTSNNAGNAPGTVSLRINDGRGSFSSPPDVAVGPHPENLALGDLDGDGDLDFATANNNLRGTLSVRLNQPALPSAIISPVIAPALTLFPNPAHGVVTITDATPNAPLTVFDALGRPLLTAAADATGTARLPLDGLTAGLYLVRSGEQVRRLTVE